MLFLNSQGEQLRLDWSWLKENCPNSLNPVTFQRGATATRNLADFRPEAKAAFLTPDQSAVVVEWADGKKSTYTTEWIEYQSQKNVGHSWGNTDILPWKNNQDFVDSSGQLAFPTVAYNSSWDAKDIQEMYEKIAKYGFCFVKIPPTPEVHIILKDGFKFLRQLNLLDFYLEAIFTQILFGVIFGIML